MSSSTNEPAGGWRDIGEPSSAVPNEAADEGAQPDVLYVYDNPTPTKVVSVILAAGLGILAFTAPWVRFSQDGMSLFASTLSRKPVDLFAALEPPESGSPGWAIAFAVLAGLTALRVLSADSSAEAAEKASGGGVLLAIAVLASWLGRSLWLNLDDIPNEIDVSMAWGYWAALAAAAALAIVPQFVAAANER